MYFHHWILKIFSDFSCDSSLSYELLEIVLFYFQVLGVSLGTVLLVISSSILLWLENILFVVPTLLKFMEAYLSWVNMLNAIKKSGYSVPDGYIVLHMTIRSGWSLVLFVRSLLLPVYFSSPIKFWERGVKKFLQYLCNFSSSHSVNVCLMHLKTIICGIHFDNWYVFLINFHFYYYELPLFISSNIICLKTYFILY